MSGVVSRWSLVVSVLMLASLATADGCPKKGQGTRGKRQVIRVVRDTVRVHDTVMVTRLVFIRDTTKLVLIREVQPNYIALMPTLKVERPEPIQERYQLNLYGGANTNGYNVLVGAQVWLGSRVSFFGGLGTIYNATTKITHLDLGGYMVIRLTEP